MNEYESVIIIKPNLDEGEIEGIITEITDLINKDGEVTKVDKMGVKTLAYEIEKNKEGYYIIFYFCYYVNLVCLIILKFFMTIDTRYHIYTPSLP